MTAPAQPQPPAEPPAEPPATLAGVVERITYQSEETGYTVARVTDEGGRLITVVGHLPGVHPGEAVALGGRWVTHPQHGLQFKAETCRLALPATVQGIEKYLGSGMIKGVGPVGARKIVEHFGLYTLDIIEQEPARLAEVHGIGQRRVAQITTAWAEQKAIKEVMLVLQSLGISTSHAVRIYKTYGDAAIGVVREDPYRLARDVYGIGFITADTIARQLGLPPDSPERVAASLRYQLSQVADDDGHLCLPRPKLVEQAVAMLARDGIAADWPALLTAAIDRLAKAGDLWLEADPEGGEDLVYLTPFRHAEVGVANRLMALLHAGPDRLAFFQTVDFDRAFGWLARRGADLTLRQREAVQTALTRRVSVLTGGPGTGKCVGGDTVVMTEQGLVPIRDLMPAPMLMADASLPISIQVHTRAGLRMATDFYYGGTQSTLVVMTSEGYGIEGTPNHRIVAATKHGPAWKSLDEVEIGDFIAIFRPPPCYEFVFDLFAYFLGLFIGDGHVNRCGVNNPTNIIITTADLEVWDFLEQEMPLMKFTVSWRATESRARRYTIGRYRWHGRGGSIGVMREWGCDMTTSKKKRIPERIIQGSLSRKRSFLMGLYDSDGSIDSRDGAIELGLSNLKLLKSVQLMLLEFGIVSVLTAKPQTESWRLNCRGDNARLFYERVGFRIRRKQDGRTRLSDRPNANLDLVPCLGDGLLRSYLKQTGKHERRWWWKWKREAKGERRPHRGRLLALLASQAIDSPEASTIRALSDPGLYWAKVTTVTPSEAEVYDLHVPDGNEFIANGLINHNTYVLSALTKLLRARDVRPVLLAPTGRAAKRLADLSGEPASTIHRLLRLRPGGGAEFDEDRPLDADLVIVDEVSMLDLLLANTLLKAIPPGAHLLLVGDVDQLPSVGPGAVLADIIRSATAPTVRLDTVFRQAQESLIIQNAYRINRGELPAYGARGRALAPREDFFLQRAETPEEAADAVVELVAARIPGRFDLAPTEIQVLSPMHRGPAGVGLLNERLQARLNPPAPHKPELRAAGRLIRLGDRLLVMRNDYERQVFNGDLGVAGAIDAERGELTVRLDDGRTAVFPLHDFDELTLAYALSIHKSQGSEFRAVVLPVLTSHYVMLARNLLYTGLTRARELAVVVGQPRALAIAVANDRVAHRYSLLAARLTAAAAKRGSR